MPLLSSLDLAGRNLNIVDDIFVAESQVLALTAAAGGDIDTSADFREQVMTVTSDETTINPVGEGVAQPENDATITNPKFDVHLWPTWRSVTTQTQKNTDPAALAAKNVAAVAPRFPINFDRYYMDLIIAGGSITEVVFDPANGVASLKSLLANFTGTSYMADGFAMTRLGMNELGWNVDADKHRMDLTQATGINVGTTGAVLADLGANAVLGLVGPWGQSSAGIAQGVEMEVFAQTTLTSGKGPQTGYVNHRAQAAMGWGNAQATNNDKTIDGAGFVVLTIAP